MCYNIGPKGSDFMPYCYNYQLAIENFYENNIIDLKYDLDYIDEEIINKLKEKSNILNNMFNHSKMTKLEKYCKKMERIKTSPKKENDFNKIATSNSTEKLLLFMFSVDPNFEAFLIYSTYNTLKEIKYEMNKTFGLYDPYLVKVERAFIKHLLNEEEKNKINEEIERRVFK